MEISLLFFEKMRRPKPTHGNCKLIVAKQAQNEYAGKTQEAMPLNVESASWQYLTGDKYPEMNMQRLLSVFIITYYGKICNAFSGKKIHPTFFFLYGSKMEAK